MINSPSAEKEDAKEEVKVAKAWKWPAQKSKWGPQAKRTKKHEEVPMGSSAMHNITELDKHLISFT